MANTTSLSGPIGTSITLRYGSTGLAIAEVTDPKNPRGGYSGPLSEGYVSPFINRSRVYLAQAQQRKIEAQRKIDASRTDPTLDAATKEYILKSETENIQEQNRLIGLWNNSIDIGEYLLNNLNPLKDKLIAAQASTTTNTTQPNAPNTAPATVPAAAPTPPPKTTGKPATTTSTGTAAAVVAATAVTTSKPATTSAPNTTGTKPATGTTGAGTVTAPTKEPKTVLKFGDEIDDIYDKNLTPEQIASLSPGDRKAREAYLKDSTSNADTAQAEIVVTAPRSAVEFDTQAQASAQDQANFLAFEDWRVRLTLAPDAEYLYRAGNPGILAPLAATDGVIFPYTPLISVNYQATYDASTIVHSNYKIYQYTNSAVDQVTISCDFTAQDTSEANYMLAVIHFFRSMTKMFYGQDQYPKPGTPPPLCYLFGLGGFQFEAHPLVITGFSYNLPNDVDYIRTTTTIDSTSVTKNGYFETAGNGRLPTGVLPGGVAAGPTFDTDGEGFTPTYVPTKIQLSITCYPIVTRNQISNEFSLTDYATGKLLQGSKRQGGGIW